MYEKCSINAVVIIKKFIANQPQRHASQLSVKTPAWSSLIWGNLHHHAWRFALLAAYQCDFMHCLCTKCSVNFKVPTLTVFWLEAQSPLQPSRY